MARGCSVRELLATTDSAELSEWIAFARVEPWGYETENWRMGQVAATVANYSNRKLNKPMTAQDFIPPPVKTKRQRVTESIAKMKAFLGG
ncbi:phage tail assembly protein T [Microbulbifer salipaludis]